MSLQIAQSVKGPATLRTYKRTFTGMRSHVCVQMTGLCERPLTDFTDMRANTGVYSAMSLKHGRLTESHVAYFTLERS